MLLETALPFVITAPVGPVQTPPKSALPVNPETKLKG